MVTRTGTRTKLLDAADELLFTRGVTSTPVDAVLARAGVSPATLYRAYGSKDGLVAAALERRHQEWLAVWDEAVAHATTDRERLLAVLDALETFRARPDGARWCAFLGTAAEYAEPPPAVAAALREESDSLHRRLEELAAPLVGARSSALADALVLLVSGQLAVRLRPGGGPGGRVSEVARRLAEMLLDHPGWSAR